MNALEITLYAERPATLPLAYNELVQGALYSFWRDPIPQLHDEGLQLDGKTFRPFTFSPLKGKRRIDGKAKTICFEGTLHLEVRTPIEALLDALVNGLAEQGEMRIGKHELRVTNLQACDRLLFPARATIRTVAPIAIYRTTEDDHTIYYSPDDDEWLQLVNENAFHKAKLFKVDCDSTLQMIPLGDTLNKRVTQFKGTYITGWMGDFIVSCNPKLLAHLYVSGLGAKNSQGFGMFNILDRPL